MGKYVLQRIGLMIITFLAITVTLFALVRFLVPAEVQYGPQQALEQARLEALGYDKPIIEQLWIFVKNIFTKGDFGTSWKIAYMQPVGQVFFEALPPTVLINVYSLLISVPLGLAIGILCARKKGKWIDGAFSVLIMVFISLPSLVTAFILQYFLGYKGDLPITTSSLYDAGGNFFTWEMFRSQILPVLALSLPTVASLARFTRAEMIESLESDYVTFARSLGIPKRKIVYHYALKNATVPILPMLLSLVVGVFSGSFIIEQIFAVPGVAKLMLTAIDKLDYDVFIACSMFYTFIGLFSSIVIDITYSLVDPRIRMGGNKYDF